MPIDSSFETQVKSQTTFASNGGNWRNDGHCWGHFGCHFGEVVGQPQSA